LARLHKNILKSIFRREEKQASILAYGSTDKGKQREGNEDSYLLMPELDIYVVADGMGGHNDGAVASLNAVRVIGEYFTPEVVSEMRSDRDKVEENLRSAVMEAHGWLLRMIEANPEYEGMGSTIAISFIHDNVLHTCHVGDSRVYVINSWGITQITKDHSAVGELVRTGEMTKEEARQSPLKNQITQAIGVSFGIEPEYNRTYTLNEGDVVLLCSDGLWEMLPDKKIQSIVLEGKPMGETCNKLIHQANEAGGNDNITVILIEMRQKEWPPEYYQ
jgi:serine/threonine protein phosphatase PrpC